MKAQNEGDDLFPDEAEQQLMIDRQYSEELPPMFDSWIALFVEMWKAYLKETKDYIQRKRLERGVGFVDRDMIWVWYDSTPLVSSTKPAKVQEWIYKMSYVMLRALMEVSSMQWNERFSNDELMTITSALFETHHGITSSPLIDKTRNILQERHKKRIRE